MIRVGRGRSREVMRSITAVWPNVEIGKSLDHPRTRSWKPFPRSAPVLWAWLDLNQRPHPYQQSRAQRCAERRFPRSLATVRGEVMRSNDLTRTGDGRAAVAVKGSTTHPIACSCRLQRRRAVDDLRAGLRVSIDSHHPCQTVTPETPNSGGRAPVEASGVAVDAAEGKPPRGRVQVDGTHEQRRHHRTSAGQFRPHLYRPSANKDPLSDPDPAQPRRPALGHRTLHLVNPIGMSSSRPGDGADPTARPGGA
jgi:hypothetical protein